jgi:hypothetical protein
LYSINILPVRQITFKHLVKRRVVLGIVLRVEIKVQDRIFLPRDVIVTVNCQTFEQFTFTLKERLKRRKQQTLAEPSRTAQKIILSLSDEAVDEFRLINIQESITDNFLKVLYPYRIFLNLIHNRLICVMTTNLNKKTENITLNLISNPASKINIRYHTDVLL